MRLPCPWAQDKWLDLVKTLLNMTGVGEVFRSSQASAQSIRDSVTECPMMQRCQRELFESVTQERMLCLVRLSSGLLGAQTFPCGSAGWGEVSDQMSVLTFTVCFLPSCQLYTQYINLEWKSQFCGSFSL